MPSSTAFPASAPKGSAFWLSFVAVVVANFLSALDMTAVSTAVPTMTNELNGEDNFVWIGSAYGLASTAILPFSGRLADVFGRHWTLQLSLLLFLVGSAISTGSMNMPTMLAGRGVAGIGAAGLLAVRHYYQSPFHHHKYADTVLSYR